MAIVAVMRPFTTAAGGYLLAKRPNGSVGGWAMGYSSNSNGFNIKDASGNNPLVGTSGSTDILADGRMHVLMCGRSVTADKVWSTNDLLGLSSAIPSTATDTTVDSCTSASPIATDLRIFGTVTAGATATWLFLAFLRGANAEAIYTHIDKLHKPRGFIDA